MVKPDEFSKGLGTPGPAARSGRCTLCVCFLGDPSLTAMRTLRSKLLLGKYRFLLFEAGLLVLLPDCLFFLFPNRSLLLGFSWRSKRGLRENTHKACSGQSAGPARGRRGSLKIRRVLPQKPKFKSRFM